jgi:hypothetical protein
MAGVKVQARQVVVLDTIDLDLGISQAVTPDLDLRCVLGW